MLMDWESVGCQVCNLFETILQLLKLCGFFVIQKKLTDVVYILGIFKGGDYLKGRYECPPYDRSTMRSVYHVRNLEVFRLKQLESNPPEIMMSHDWPRGIHDYGDTQRLLRRKQFFAEDIANNQLGSGPAMEVLQTLKPAYWFAGHLHVKFAALVHHEHTEQDKKG